MKTVGIDVSMVPDSPVGAGRYVLELVKHLESLTKSFNLVLFSRKGDVKRWEDFAEHTDNVNNIMPNSRVLRLAYENLSLGKHLNGVDLLHSPHYSVPYGIKIPLIVNIHDLIFFENPGFHQLGKVIYFKSQIKLAVKKADYIICGTEYIKEKITKMFNPHSSIEVVPYGVDLNEFKRESSKEDADEKIMAELKLNSPFLLYVGTIEPRKKVDDLVKAFNLLVNKNLISDDIKLVLAGKFGWKFEQVKTLLESDATDGRVIHLGYVKQSYMGPLFRKALAVVYPSETEGFGLPVLEAMAAKTSVITTNDSAMQHFAKDAATYFTAGDIDELASKILEVVESYCESFKLEIGFGIASEYSWENSVRRHADLYEKILG